MPQWLAQIMELCPTPGLKPPFRLGWGRAKAEALAYLEARRGWFLHGATDGEAVCCFGRNDVSGLGTELAGEDAGPAAILAIVLKNRLQWVARRDFLAGVARDEGLLLEEWVKEHPRTYDDSI